MNFVSLGQQRRLAPFADFGLPARCQPREFAAPASLASRADRSLWKQNSLLNFLIWDYRALDCRGRCSRQPRQSCDLKISSRQEPYRRSGMPSLGWSVACALVYFAAHSNISRKIVPGQRSRFGESLAELSFAGRSGRLFRPRPSRLERTCHQSARRRQSVAAAAAEATPADLGCRHLEPGDDPLGSAAAH
jgi:hypothetical protein